MKLNPYRTQHFDQECERLISLLESVPLNKIVKGGLKAIRISDDKFEIEMTDPFTLNIGEKIWWCENGQGIGFNETNESEFQKLVSVVSSDPAVKPYISRQYIKAETFQCLINARKKDDKSNVFSTSVLKNLENSIQSYNVYLKVLKLNAPNKFKIGDVEIDRFNGEFFDKHIAAFKRKYKKDHILYPRYKKHFVHHTYAKVYIRAEAERAKELALEKCSFAIDILKITSPTTFFPKHKLLFGIDNEARLDTDQYVLLENLEKDQEITANIMFAKKPFEEPEFNLSSYKKRGLDMFIGLLAKFPHENNQSELQRIMVTSIKRFAAALSEPNLHRRIADLFIILDSLAVSDENAGIQESVTRYLPKLVWDDIEKRKACIKLIKKMYGIRSKYMHHASEAEFEISELAELQVNVYSFIAKMTMKSIDYKTKRELFDEIDDAIIAAYTPEQRGKRKKATTMKSNANTPAEITPKVKKQKSR